MSKENKITPCVGKCVYNKELEKCSGCNRPIYLIKKWPSLSKDERELVLDQLNSNQAI